MVDKADVILSGIWGTLSWFSTTNFTGGGTRRFHSGGIYLCKDIIFRNLRDTGSYEDA